MSNISALGKNLTNATDVSECGKFYDPIESRGELTSVATASQLLASTVNLIICPLTVLLNVLVIAAVRKRSRLQSNNNILLACLAGTDLLTGLVVEPLLLAMNVASLLGAEHNSCVLYGYLIKAFRFVSFSSLMHLTLVTFERFIAIKYTMHYVRIITEKTIKIAVASIWTLTILWELLRFANTHPKVPIFSSAVFIFLVVFCIFFIIISYVLIFRETSRHRKQIVSQQLSQEEKQRFLKENKAFKTTAYVVGAVILCYVPLILVLSVVYPRKVLLHLLPIARPWILTSTALNSLLNPLIYCWRQEEMRRFVLRNPCSAVAVGPG